MANTNKQQKEQDTIYTSDAGAGDNNPVHAASVPSSEAGAGVNPPVPAAPVSTGAGANKTTVYCKLPHGIIFRVEKTSVSLTGGLDRNAVAGFGVTEVDAEAWEVIAKKYAKHPAIVNKLIFARTIDGESQAAELKDEKSGFEGINPNKPPAGVEPAKGDK
jgi:hypothetical protein